tara:strand:+ start:874 stop:2187 length:1314 start_codon:yes stop_codon:yes gene_type:complete
MANIIKPIIKAATKKRGRPKVDKRKGRGKRAAQSKARQQAYQQRQTEAAEKAGTTKAGLARERMIDKKISEIRNKDISGNVKTNAIAEVKETKGKISVADAIKKAENAAPRVKKVMSRARKETAKLRSRGAFKGFSEEQMKERRSLIRKALQDMKNEGKERVTIMDRTLSLTPEGEKLLKTRGGTQKIIAASGPTGTKKNQYLYQTMDEQSTVLGKKVDKDTYKQMRLSEKLEYIQKRFAPDFTTTQLKTIMMSKEPGVRIANKPKNKIEGLRNRLKAKGLLPPLGAKTPPKVSGEQKAVQKNIQRTESQINKIRNKDIPVVEQRIDRAQAALKNAKTSEVKNKLRKEITEAQTEKRRLTNIANDLQQNKVSDAKKQATKISSPSSPTRMGTKTATVNKRKGGKVGMYKSGKQIKSKSPRGCGAAMRGYGKAMKGMK